MLAPHGIIAARELLADLRQSEDLAPYLLPEIWLKQDQSSAIASLAVGRGIALAVGLAENTLPDAGQQSQGGHIGIGLALYCFISTLTADIPAKTEEAQALWYTAISLAGKYAYTLPNGTRAPARLAALETVPLNNIPTFADTDITAEALTLEIRIRI